MHLFDKQCREVFIHNAICLWSIAADVNDTECYLDTCKKQIFTIIIAFVTEISASPQRLICCLRYQIKTLLLTTNLSNNGNCFNRKILRSCAVKHPIYLNNF